MTDYVLLTDPEWQDGEDKQPPADAIIGMWPLQPDGSVGTFRSNPDYRPRFENSPADPVDALVRLAMHGEAELEQLRAMLRDSLVELALNGDGRPLLVNSPDNELCAVVATSAVPRQRIFSPDWRRVSLAELVAVLPGNADVLINPNGPAWVRLSGDFVRDATG